MFKSLCFLSLCLVALPCAAQQFDFPSGATEDPAALSKSMPGLAREVIAVYREDDRRQYLDNLFRLQMVAGQYAEANESLASLRPLLAGSVSPQTGAAGFCTRFWPRPGRARRGSLSRRRFSARSVKSSAGWTIAPRPWRCARSASTFCDPAGLEGCAGAAERQERHRARRRADPDPRLSGRSKPFGASRRSPRP